MESQTPERKRGRLLKRIAIVLLRVTVTVIVLLAVARFAWRFSGSNQWELVREGKGAKVYALKQPGADLLQLKGTVQVRSTLAGVVSWLQDPSTCADIGCKDVRIVEKVSDQINYSAFRYDVPPPFRSREFVLRQHVHQIPETREVWAEFAAVPDKIPHNSCCLRVTHLLNTWKLTPLDGGIVDVEYTINMNEGGFVPDLLLNMERTKYLFWQLKKMQKYVEQEKYQRATFDFIVEKEGVPVMAAAPDVKKVVNQ